MSHDYRPVMVIHVKIPCRDAFRKWPNASHVFDRVDNFHENVRKHNFSGGIFSDEAQLQQCVTRVCVVIPHHTNLDCRVRSNQEKIKSPPVIGLVGTATSHKDIVPKDRIKGRGGGGVSF